MMRCLLLCVWLGASASFSMTAVAAGSGAAALDPTFKMPRLHFSAAEQGGGRCLALALDNEGRILVGGSFVVVNEVLRTNLVRLLPDGSVDLSFEAKVAVRIQEQGTIAVQSDGKILVPAVVWNEEEEREYLTVARLLPDGSLDASFKRPRYMTVNHIMPAPDGKIYLAGPFENEPAGPRYLARLNGDGSFDESFGSPPILEPPWPESGMHIKMALQPDGKVVLAGAFLTEGGNHFLARFNEDGSEDLTFSQEAPKPDYCEALVLLRDGSILHGWNLLTTIDYLYGNRTLLGHYNPDRSLRTQNMYTNIPGRIHELLPQPDGRVLLGGRLYDDSLPRQGNLVRLNADLTLDATFDVGLGFSNGKFRPERSGEVNAMLFDGNGRILVGGVFDRYDGTPCGGVVRLAGEAVYLTEQKLSGIGDVSFEWETMRTNSTYRLEASSDLRNWSAVNATRTGHRVRYSETIAERRFIRVIEE